MKLIIADVELAQPCALRCAQARNLLALPVCTPSLAPRASEPGPIPKADTGFVRERGGLDVVSMRVPANAESTTKYERNVSHKQQRTRHLDDGTYLSVRAVSKESGENGQCDNEGRSEHAVQVC